MVNRVVDIILDNADDFKEQALYALLGYEAFYFAAFLSKLM